MNNTPLVWVCKRQRTVESSTYGAELVAARMAVDLIIEMRYKLRMLGVKLEDRSVMVGDNMSVVLNTTIPSSVLKKKHLACSYHRIREAIAGEIVEFGKILSEENLADVNTKPLGANAFHRLVGPYLFRTPLVTQLGKQKTQEKQILANTCSQPQRGVRELHSVWQSFCEEIALSSNQD